MTAQKTSNRLIAVAIALTVAECLTVIPASQFHGWWILVLVLVGIAVIVTATISVALNQPPR